MAHVYLNAQRPCGKMVPVAGTLTGAANPQAMVSALLMLRRLLGTLRYARREEDFDRIAGAAVLLVVVATLAYSLGAGWHAVDAFYFAISTLTTTSVADPDLALDDRWLKLFTVFFQLIGIGIAVEILRRMAVAFVAYRASEAAGSDD
jgi:hypothetical protein